MISPDLIGVAAAAAAGLGLGLPFAFGVGLRLGWELPGVLALSFAGSIVSVGLGAVLAAALGGGLVLGAGIALAVATIPAILVLRRARGVGLGVGAQGLTLGALAGGLAYFERPWFEYVSDTFYHLAAARSLLASDSTLVTDPFYGTSTTSLDPTSGVFHSWMAMTSRVSGVEVEQVFFGMTVLGAAALVWAFWYLARRVSDSQTIATIATVAFVFLGLWGDLRMAGLPNRFTVAFLCIALLALWESATGERGRGARLAAIVAGAAALFSHIASAGVFIMFALSAAVATSLFGRRLRAEGARGPAVLPALVALVLAVPVLAPRLAVVADSSMTTGGSDLPSTFIRLPANLVIAQPGAYVGGGAVAFILMAVVAALALGVGARHRDGRTLTLAAFVSMPVVFLLFPPVTTLAVNISRYMTARLALMLKFVPFLAVAWILGEAFRARRGEAGSPSRTGAYRGFSVLLGAGILVAHLWVSWPLTQVTFVRIEDQMRNGEAYTVYESRDTDVRDSWGPSALWDARSTFGDEYPIVAASPETGYYLAGLANCAIVAAPPSHSPLAVETVDGPQRRADMEMLLDPRVTVRERAEILTRRDADYVALSPGTGIESLTWDSMRAQPELFEPVVVTRRFVLLRVLR